MTTLSLDCRADVDEDLFETEQDWLSGEGWRNLNTVQFLAWDDWIREIDLDAYYVRERLPW